MAFRLIYNWLTRKRPLQEAELSKSDGLASALYRIPTITNELPPLEPPSMPAGPMSLVLHEDSWRQVELLPRSLEAEASEHLAAIREHLNHASEGPGFRAVHVRRLLPRPLLSISRLEAALGPRQRGGLYLNTDVGMCRVHSGAAAELAGSGVLYWLDRNEEAHVLGLSVLGVDPANGDLAPLVALSNQHNLILIDWIAAEVINSSSEDQLRAWVKRAVERDNAFVD
jgi:hypothetical protein